MERDMEEILQSQAAMLRRLGKAAAIPVKQPPTLATLISNRSATPKAGAPRWESTR